MNPSSSTPKPGEPGHYGAGYGEDLPADDPAAPPPDLETNTDAPAGLEPLERRLDPDAPSRA